MYNYNWRLRKKIKLRVVKQWFLKKILHINQCRYLTTRGLCTNQNLENLCGRIIYSLFEALQYSMRPVARVRRTLCTFGFYGTDVSILSYFVLGTYKLTVHFIV